MLAPCGRSGRIAPFSLYSSHMHICHMIEYSRGYEDLSTWPFLVRLHILILLQSESKGKKKGKKNINSNSNSNSKSKTKKKKKDKNT